MKELKDMYRKKNFKKKFSTEFQSNNSKEMVYQIHNVTSKKNEVHSIPNRTMRTNIRLIISYTETIDANNTKPAKHFNI